MKIIDQEKINCDLYLLELTNDHEERSTDASLHIIIRYCIENRCQISKLSGILARYLMRQDLNADESNSGASGCKKFHSLHDVDILNRIISTIDILDSGYYVYLLKDSSTNTAFYVGMGAGSHISDYELYDRNNNHIVNRKLKNKIMEIQDTDHEISYVVVDTNLSEDEASIVQQLLHKEYGLQKNSSLLRSSFSKVINFFNKIFMTFINSMSYKRSGYIAQSKETHLYSDIEIEHIVEQILFDFNEYLRDNISIPTYDCYENRYKMDGYL
jgi:hypothetical protein